MKLNFKHKVGDLVAFLGLVHKDHKDTLIGVLPPDSDPGKDHLLKWFVARVSGYPLGVCYGLEFLDGTPIGIPFCNDELIPASECVFTQVKASKQA